MDGLFRFPSSRLWFLVPTMLSNLVNYCRAKFRLELTCNWFAQNWQQELDIVWLKATHIKRCSAVRVGARAACWVCRFYFFICYILQVLSLRCDSWSLIIGCIISFGCCTGLFFYKVQHEVFRIRYFSLTTTASSASHFAFEHLQKAVMLSCLNESWLRGQVTNGWIHNKEYWSRAEKSISYNF